MVGAELKNGAPQNFFLKFGAEIVPLKKFFSGFGAEMAPSSLKMRPFQGGVGNGGILVKFAPL
jgi:hypothetical protein